MIYCGNHFCAYWFEGICMKEDIRLDNRGVCLTWRAGRYRPFPAGPPAGAGPGIQGRVGGLREKVAG